MPRDERPTTDTASKLWGPELNAQIYIRLLKQALRTRPRSATQTTVTKRVIGAAVTTWDEAMLTTLRPLPLLFAATALLISSDLAKAQIYPSPYAFQARLEFDPPRFLVVTAEGLGLGFENEETAGRVAGMLNRMVEAINRCDRRMYKLTLSSYEEIKKTFGAEAARETPSHVDSLGTEDYVVPLFHENCAKRR